MPLLARRRVRLDPATTQIGEIDVSGDVLAGGLRSSSIDAPAGAQLNLGPTDATKVNVGRSGVVTQLNGSAIDCATNLGFNATANRTIQIYSAADDVNGWPLTVQSGNGGDGVTGGGRVAGQFTLRAGTGGAGTAANSAGGGGTLTLSSGNGGVNNGGGGAASGNMTINAGTSTHTNLGTLSMWTSTGSGAATVGRSGQTFTINGVLGFLSQTPTFSATMAINPSAGAIIQVTLSASLGVWTLTNGLTSGQIIMLTFLQDATGSRTIGTPPANITWLPTTYLGTTRAAPTLTTTAAKRDTFWFQYHQITTKWLEIHRQMNY
jgi:hypothetical protein